MVGFPGLVLEALATGILVAFVALGYSLVYGILRFVNFAHGEIVATSAYVALFVSNGLGTQSIWVVYLIGGTSGAAVAVIIERLVYRPIRGSNSLTLLLASFGASMVLQATMGIIWGARSRALPIENPTIEIFATSIRLHYILLVALALGAAMSLEYCLRRSVWGLVIRGFSKNPFQVAALGVPTNRAIITTFLVTGFFAGVAGVCVGMQSGVAPQMGLHIGLWAFAATVVGGLGSLRGALLGGFLLGVLLAVATRFLSVLHTDGMAFIAMALVLLVRPKGLFAFLDREV